MSKDIKKLDRHNRSVNKLEQGVHHVYRYKIAKKTIRSFSSGNNADQIRNEDMLTVDSTFRTTKAIIADSAYGYRKYIRRFRKKSSSAKSGYASYANIGKQETLSKQTPRSYKNTAQNCPMKKKQTDQSIHNKNCTQSFSGCFSENTIKTKTAYTVHQKRICQKSKKKPTEEKVHVSSLKSKYISQKAKKAAAKKSTEQAAAKTIGAFGGSGLFIIAALVLFIISAAVVIILCICGSQAEEEERKRQNASSTTASVSDAVLQYAPLITQYANDNGIGRYVALLEAVMMQESGGMGVNVMQVDFTSVSTVEESIQMGVSYFRTCLEMARVTSPEDIDHIKVALQGYNYGTGYITWVWRNYDGEYTPENAQLFSDNQKALLGWQIYGDPQYVDHVLRYYHYGESGGVEFITDGASFAWPVPGHTNITSGFGARWGTMHKGIDISDGNIQGVPVVASRAGTVTRADNACTHNYPKNSSCGCGGGYGNRVEISHGDGTSTLYGHMVTITVSVGQTVEQGQVIGYIGSTGHSTGYHLHFEIKQNGVQVDPMLYL